ncbi:MAG: formimidoylglutamase, partial [Bacteroidales bacterium]|nr:formimidoylglutamase [Bacteroidales bacterium]
LDQFDLALIGVPEDRNATVAGSAAAPDQVRDHLYQLYRVNPKLKIIDLGNLKCGNAPQDTYFALRDVLLDLLERKLISVILGGSQDLTYGIYLAFEKLDRKFSFATIDSRLDMGIIDDKIKPESYLIPILSRKKELLFSYTNLGHQTYFVDQGDVDFLKDNFHQTLRLGEIRHNVSRVEPYLRDAGFVSLDMNSIRQSDAPACTHPSPNGFTGEDICQISRYAGLSPVMKCFGLFNLLPDIDRSGQTAQLAAQTLWYFIDGVSQRKEEHPLSAPDAFKKFIVSFSDMDHDIIFYKSLETERWWFEVPVIRQTKTRHVLISCAMDDYQKACNQEIPDRWLNAFQKLN